MHDNCCRPQRDIQDDRPMGFDDNGAEIWPGDHTVFYEGREILLETFQDEILRLVGKAPLTLAEALGLETVHYE